MQGTITQEYYEYIQWAKHYAIIAFVDNLIAEGKLKLIPNEVTNAKV